jgi:outer membrane receptor protein involved in Fe transport
MTWRKRLHRYVLPAIAGIAVWLAMYGVTWADEALRAFDIPPQGLDSALTDFSRQADVIVVASSQATRGKRAPQVSGHMPPSEALNRLLHDSGLQYSVGSDGGFTIGQPDSGEAAQPRPLALAQTTPPDRDGPTGADSQSSPMAERRRISEIEEVVVTAQKRDQNLQDVALSISALSSNAIDRRGLDDMSDYLNTVPGVTIVDRGTSRRSIAIRGLAIDPTFEAGSQATVGIYFGDTPLTSLNFGINGDRGGNLVPRLVDMERVEVLRGPQGTLYGASSIAGTVRYIPKEPDPAEPEARVATELSFTEMAGEPNTMFQGMVNLPFLDNSMAFRAVAYHFSDAGYIDDIGADDPDLQFVAELNDVLGQAGGHADIGASDVVGYRAGLAWYLSDRFSARLSYTYERQRQEGLLEVQTDLPGKYQQSRLDLNGSVKGNLFAPGGRGNDDSLELVNLVLEYDLGFGSIYSSSSWGDNKATATFSARGTVAGFQALHLPWQQDFTHSGYMQELRFTSQFDGPFQFIAGAYYENTERDFTQIVYYGGDEAAYDALVVPIFGPNPYFPKFFGDEHDVDFRQVSYFGEATYQLTEQWEATVGARRFDYDTRQVISNSHFPFLGTPPAEPETRNAVDKDTIFKGNISYRPTEDTLVYAQWSEGFRQATPNAEADNQLVSTLCDQNDDGVIDGTNIRLDELGNLRSDSSENYELGVKLSDLFDGRVLINAALYQVNWSGLPLTLRTDCGAFFQLNSGDARSRGLEVESSILVAENLVLTLNGSYVDAELTEDFPAIGGEKGDPLPGSADFTFTAGLEYDFEFRGLPAYVTGDVNYVSSFYNDVREIPPKTGGYAMANVRAGVRLAEHFTLEAFVRNLTGADDLTWVESPAVNTDDRAARLRPRTVGIAIRYDL